MHIMPRKILYSLNAGPEYNKFGLRESFPSQAILLSDNKSSIFSLKNIVQDESLSILKRIYDIKSLAKSTNILSNSIDILMTDRFSKDGEPLPFKVIKKVKFPDKILINGIEHTDYDANFIYTHLNSGKVEYVSKNGDIIFTEDAEFFPMFIWENYIHLSDIIAKDNKTFSYSSNKEKILIKCSKSNVFASVTPGSIFELKNDSEMLFHLDPFIYRNIREVDGEKVTFDYDYSRVLPNLRTVKCEDVKLVNNDILKLSNGKIIKDTVKVSIVDTKSGVEIYSLDNSEESIGNHNINASKGEINIKNFLDHNSVDPKNYIFIASYNYLDLIGNKVFLDSQSVSLKNRKAFFNIKPTRIKNGSLVTNFEPSILYTITEQNGEIVSSIDEAIPLYEYTIPVYKGFGEDAYSEHGYSGITDEIDDEIVMSADSTVGTGFGENAYSDGPFGGSFLKNIEDIRRLLDIQNNSVAGSIEIAEIDFTARIDEAHIYDTKRVAKSKKDIPFKKLDLFAGSIWHTSIDGSYSDISIAAGMHKYESISGISFPGYIVDDSSSVAVSFDISSISQFMNTDGSFNDSMVMTDLDAISTIGLYNNLPLATIDKDSFKLYHKSDSISELSLNIIIEEDLSRAYVLIPSELASSISNEYIGLGINTVYPSVWTKV